jgi:hypothetical protein
MDERLGVSVKEHDGLGVLGFDLVDDLLHEGGVHKPGLVLVTILVSLRASGAIKVTRTVYFQKISKALHAAMARFYSAIGFYEWDRRLVLLVLFRFGHNG